MFEKHKKSKFKIKIFFETSFFVSQLNLYCLVHVKKNMKAYLPSKQSENLSADTVVERPALLVNEITRHVRR